MQAEIKTNTKLTMSKKMKKFLNSSTMLNLMYIPALILFIIFIFYPFIKGIMISFTNWDGYSLTYDWVGLEKYKSIFSDRKVILAIKNTFIYGVGSTVFQNLIGLLYALFLDREIKGRGIVRTIVYLPAIMSPLIMGYIWYFFFQYSGGALNDILILFKKAPMDWLAEGPRAVKFITVVNTYQFLGVAMIIYLAGLQSIPKMFYEAAEIDGASKWAKFTKITIPFLMPAITTSFVINIIGGLKLFDVIIALTNGGPGYASQSLSTMIYNLYFGRQDAGYAAALGILMFVIICIFSIITLRYFRRKEIDY